MNNLLTTETSTSGTETGSPLVSVILLTYNHERFIEPALRSIMAQEFSEPVEVLVAEDYSTDRTRDVLNQLQREFPDRFCVLDRGRNLGLSANLEDAWKRCRGKYIALLEGDDHWTDPQKLAKVVAALELHPDWTGCFHAIQVTNEMTGAARTILPDPFPGKHVGVLDLLPRNWVPTYSTIIYRCGVVTDFPEWHRKVACGDWGLHVLHAEHGPIGFLPEVLTDYRVHASGMWSGMGEVYRLQQQILMFNYLDAHFKGKYASEIEDAQRRLLADYQQTLDDLRKIERRYLGLRLDRLAGAARWLRQLAQKLLGRS